MRKRTPRGFLRGWVVTLSILLSTFATAGLPKGSVVELTRDEPLKFYAVVLRDGLKGERFAVEFDDVVRRRVYLRTRNELGQIVAVSVPVECVVPFGQAKLEASTPAPDAKNTQSSLFAQTFRVTTWNMEWFPSGSPKPLAEEVENKRISEAATVIRNINPDVLLLEEIRDWATCEKLATALKPSIYHVLVCSAFKEPFGGGVGKQQVAIVARQTAQTAWSENWKSSGNIDPPRGFAFATIRFGNADVGFYAVHLKSNLIMKADKAAEMQKNILKRQISALQIVAHVKDVEARLMPTVRDFVIGGDFNTNPDQPDFAKEQTFLHLEEAGFRSVFGKLPATGRVTHPGGGRYPDATFDYIFVSQGCTAGPPKITVSALSDHYPVSCDIKILRN